MKSLSPDATALLRRLDEATDKATDEAPGTHRDEDLARALAESPEPGLVLPVFLRLFRSWGKPARVLIPPLEALVARLGPNDVRELDRSLRHSRSEYDSVEYAQLDAGELEHFAALSPAVAALLTCHPNGRRRQAALQHLGGFPLAWPFLLLRLNDWALPVREAAREAAAAMLPEVPFAVLLRHLPLVESLGLLGRAAHAPFQARVMARLRQPDGRAWLVSNFRTLEGPARRMALRLVLENPGERDRPLLEACLEDPDTRIQEIAAGRVDTLFSGEELACLLDRMECSRAMGVRREAYAVYARLGTGPGEAKVREALGDRSPSIRDWAQRRLAGTVDVAGWYRAALVRRAPRPGAVAGLGETGAAPDAALLVPFLTHPHPPLRRAALIAVARLDGDGHVEALRTAWKDTVPSISRAAVQALTSKTTRVSADWLHACFALPELPPHALHALFLLTGSVTAREALLVLLAATGRPEEARRVGAHAALEQWPGNSSRPSIPRSMEIPLSTLQEAVRAARGLEPQVAHRVTQWLSRWE